MAAGPLERGAGSVLGLLVVAVVATAVCAASVLGVGLLARHRAATAADLAALAAAGAPAGSVPCVAAAVVAQVNGARLGSCRWDGSTADVVAMVRPGRWGALLGEVRRSARAGPAPAH